MTSTPTTGHGIDPRTALRAIVSDHASAAAAASSTTGQSWAHQHAAELLARCDPRAWGGADGLSDTAVRDRILVEIDRAAAAADALDSSVAAHIHHARRAIATPTSTSLPVSSTHEKE